MCKFPGKFIVPVHLKRGRMRSIVRGAVFILIIALVVALLHVWLKNKSYVFDQDTIFDITRKAIANLNTTGKTRAINKNIVIYFLSGKATHTEIFEEVTKRLEAKYPNYILPKRDREWIFINFGGCMASFYLLHGSISEYIYFMGTAMHTSGHAGMTRVKFYFEEQIFANLLLAFTRKFIPRKLESAIVIVILVVHGVFSLYRKALVEHF